MPDHSSQGIARDNRGEEQPSDAKRATTAHQSDAAKSASREATRNPKLSDASPPPVPA